MKNIANRQSEKVKESKKKHQLSNFQSKNYIALMLFKFQDEIMIDIFNWIWQKTKSIGKVLIPLENLKFKATFEIRRRSFFAQISTRAQFTNLLADELQSNSKSAYKSKSIYNSINMYESTTEVIKAY